MLVVINIILIRILIRTLIKWCTSFEQPATLKIFSAEGKRRERKKKSKIQNRQPEILKKKRNQFFLKATSE
jgi:hypothetical protein